MGSHRLLFVVLVALALVCLTQVHGHDHGDANNHKKKTGDTDASDALMISSIVQSAGSIAIGKVERPVCEKTFL